MSSNVKLLLPADYISDATKNIKTAQKRISLLSMVVADDETTNELIDALSEAAKRGVTVEVAADIFTYGELGGFFLPTRYRSRKSRETSKMAKEFKKNGVKFTWLGKSRTTIFNGRTHIKWCVVDDTVYSFGGVNLYQKGIENIDYILKLTNNGLADKLTNEYHRLVKADAKDYAYRSHEFACDDDKIFIDGGFFGDSIIYRQACKLASQATKIKLVSQYCPTGKLARIINQKESYLYFNPIKNATIINKIVIGLGMILSGNKTLFDKSRYLHAKFILFYMPNGKVIALTGSHNFVSTGVILGTREIAMQTENPAITKQLEDFLNNYVV